MDISKLDAEVAKDEEAVDIPIYQKNGEPYLAADGSQSTIGVLGRESQRYRDAEDTLSRAAIVSARRRSKLEPADLRGNRIALVAAVVTGWHGWESGGKDWPCTPENVKAMLSKQHIFEQVEAGVDGHADFFMKRSKV